MAPSGLQIPHRFLFQFYYKAGTQTMGWKAWVQGCGQRTLLILHCSRCRIGLYHRLDSLANSSGHCWLSLWNGKEHRSKRVMEEYPSLPLSPTCPPLPLPSHSFLPVPIIPSPPLFWFSSTFAPLLYMYCILFGGLGVGLQEGVGVRGTSGRKGDKWEKRG